MSVIDRIVINKIKTVWREPLPKRKIAIIFKADRLTGLFIINIFNISVYMVILRQLS